MLLFESFGSVFHFFVVAFSTKNKKMFCLTFFSVTFMFSSKQLDVPSKDFSHTFMRIYLYTLVTLNKMEWMKKTNLCCCLKAQQNDSIYPFHSIFLSLFMCSVGRFSTPFTFAPNVYPIAWKYTYIWIL